MSCPVCGTPTPANRRQVEDWCCSVACYRSFHGLDRPEVPSRHDGVTMSCPVCQLSFSPVGRQSYCSDACRAAAYRRRRAAGRPSVTIPQSQPRRPISVYECATCGTRTVGEQYCTECATFMSRVDTGGSCLHCDEAVTLAELLTAGLIAIKS